MKNACNPLEIIVLQKSEIQKKGDKNLKIFFGSTFIKKEILKEAGIYYPIKLEYYKIINEDEMIKREKPRFGIGIVKTEYREKDIKVENKIIKYLSNDEKRIEEILKIFKENEVTPIGVNDIINDLSKQVIFIQ